MKKTESIEELAKALVKFHAEVPAITKDADNPFFKSKYASLGNIISTIAKPLSENGLAVTQFPANEDELTTILMHTSGQYLQATVKITPKDKTPQGIGSAITYMRRYALSAVLGLSTDEDDDGNAATQPKTQARAAAPTKKAPTAPKLPSDPFLAAKVMVDAAKDIDAVIAVSDRVDASDKFTAEQKAEIKKIAALKVDQFDNVTQEAA